MEGVDLLGCCVDALSESEEPSFCLILSNIVVMLCHCSLWC